MIGFFLLIPLIVAVYMMAFSLPLCRAMAGALEFVRDPAQRVLPGDPWELFLAQLKQRLWRPARWLAGLIVLVFVGSLFFNLFITNTKPNVGEWIFDFASFVIVTVGLALMITAMAILCAPRMSAGAAIFCVSLGGPMLYVILGVAWIALSKFLIDHGFPEWLIEWESVQSNSTGTTLLVNSYLTCQFYFMIPAALLAWWLWRRARRQGEAWFRFEQ